MALAEPVTESNCSEVTSCGEQQEVKIQSVVNEYDSAWNSEEPARDR